MKKHDSTKPTNDLITSEEGRFIAALSGVDVTSRRFLPITWSSATYWQLALFSMGFTLLLFVPNESVAGVTQITPSDGTNTLVGQSFKFNDSARLADVMRFNNCVTNPEVRGDSEGSGTPYDPSDPESPEDPEKPTDPDDSDSLEEDPRDPDEPGNPDKEW